MIRALRMGMGLAATLAAVLTALSAPAVAAERVDLLLVLAADVSRSMDDPKFRLQRSGYVEALTNPRVIEAIQSGTNRRIAVSFIEWSGVVSQKVVIDWAAIGDEASARRFADGLVEAPRSFADRTSISAGIDFAMAQFERSPYEGVRRTVDVSGDGTNNSGREVTAARDEAVAKGVTINGLVILSDSPTPWNPEHTNPPGGLANYYRNNVVGGPGAFVMIAENFKSFGTALINKLIAEIAQVHQPRHAALR
ncbi:MAG: DUF1194 domain-containing protein [Xanthobacteraceae bacterium]